MSQLDDLMASLVTQKNDLATATGIVQAMQQAAAPAIKTANDFDTAYAAAQPKSTLTLDPTFVYSKAFVLDKPVSLMSAAPVAGRAVTASGMPLFPAGFTVTANGVAMVGIEYHHTDPTQDIVATDGARDIVMDGYRILGDPVNGAKRGIRGNSANLKLTRGYIAQIKSGAQDAQAFCAWDSPGPFWIEDNYWSASGETLMFGGADPTSANGVPSYIVIRGNTLTKDPAWQTQAVDVKNTLELKLGRHVLIENNDISNSWAYGQNGYLIVVTVRNQGGAAPFSTIDGVTIRNNVVHDGAAFLQLLGSDSDFPSGPLQNLIVDSNRVYNIDPQKFSTPAAAGSDKLILCSVNKSLPANVAITNNVFSQCANIHSALYLSGGDGTKAQNMTFTGNVLPASWYGVMGDGCSPSSVNGTAIASWGDTGQPNPTGAWLTFIGSGTISGNTVA